MSATIIAFRPALGTNATDLADVRRILREAEGWAIEEMADPAGYHWIAAAAPDGSDWIITRENGKFHAIPPDEDGGAAIVGRTSAADVAADVRRFVGVVLVHLDALPPGFGLVR